MMILLLIRIKIRRILDTFMCVRMLFMEKDKAFTKGFVDDIDDPPDHQD